MDGLISPDRTTRPQLLQALIGAGAFFHQRGWVPATGGNFSARFGSDLLLITGSGVHKGALEVDDFLDMNLRGQVIGGGRPSYETGLHLQIYRRLPDVGAVLHVHSIANTVLSRRHDTITLQGYELQKTLPGQPDPQTAVAVPVFANDQDIGCLADTVDRYMQHHPRMPAYLIAGHGLYAWGADVAQARHRVEALEFMFECELQQQRICDDERTARI